MQRDVNVIGVHIVTDEHVNSQTAGRANLDKIVCDWRASE
jgi:hypothetical protein